MVREILRSCAEDPEVPTERQWAVLLNHAEDRDAFTALARSVTRLKLDPAALGRSPNGRHDQKRYRSFHTAARYREIRDECFTTAVFS